MFAKVIKSVVKQLDPDRDFIPVRSPLAGEHFKLLFLVKKKRKKMWQKSNYDKTDFKLHDVLLLEDHPAQLDVQESPQFTIEDQVDGNVEAEISGQVAVPTVEVNSGGSVNMSRSQSVKVKMIYISSQRLDSIIKEGKLNMCHDFIKQSEEFQGKLYVITEVIETVEPTVLVEFNQINGKIGFGIFIKTIKAAIKHKRETKVILPKACILAFSVKRLLIRGGSLEISYYDDHRKRTFGRVLLDDAVIMKEGDQEKVTKYNLKDLQREVKKECAELSLLSADLCGIFISGFVAIMTDSDLLEELEFQLEQALEGTEQLKPKADRPELQDLLKDLQDSSGATVTHLAESVLYFLQALKELTELQLILLTDSVEKKIVCKQLALVESIVNNGSSRKEWKFTVDAQNFTEDDLNITGAMIELSGVIVQKIENSLAGTGDPDAYSALSALYVALHVLNLLSR